MKYLLNETALKLSALKYVNVKMKENELCCTNLIHLHCVLTSNAIAIAIAIFNYVLDKRSGMILRNVIIRIL